MMDATKGLDELLDEYIQLQLLKHAALAERAKYEADPENYYPYAAPNELRYWASVSLYNVKNGIRPTLFYAIETSDLALMARICELAELPENEPMLPLVEHLIRVRQEETS